MVDEKTLQDPIDPVDTDQLAQAPEGEVLVKADDNFFNQVYSDFWDKGYSGDKNDFFQLLCSNPEAFNDAYELVSSQGYKGSVDDFKAQLGVTEEAEKKNPNSTTEIGSGVSEDTSLQSQEKDPYNLANKKKEDQNKKAYQEFAAYIDKKNKEAGRETPKPKDQGEFKAITEVDEQYRISKGDIQARKERKERLKRVAKGEEEVSLKDSAITSVGNMLNQIVGTETYAQWGMSLFLKEMTSEGIQDEIKDITGIDADLWFAEQNARREKMKSYVGPTLGFTDMTTMKMPVMVGGSMQVMDVPEPTLDNAGKFVAGFFNATTSFGASAVQARLTGGVGLVTDLIARGIETYNESKAEDLGISSRELYESGEAEILPGLVVGALSYGLEKLGIDEVLNPTFFRGIPSGVVERFIQGVVASGVEGGTEYVQAILEKANELSAKRNPGDVGEILGKYLTSKEAMEALLQGMAGGFSMSTLKNGYDFISGVKTDEQRNRVTELVKEISSIEDQLTKPHFSNEEKSALKQTRNAYVQEIRDINQEVDDLAKVLPDEAVQKIKQLYKEQVGLNNQLINVVNSENLTEEQKEQVIDALEKQFKQRDMAIKDLIKSYGYDGKAKTTQEFVREKGDPVSQESPDSKKPRYYYGDGVDLSDENQFQKYQEELDKGPDSNQTSLLAQAKKAMDAISEILPDVNFVFHKTNDSFVEAVGEKSEAGGGFVPIENTIHINVSKANDTTVAHETFHALLRNVANGDILKSSVKELLDAVAPDIAGTPLAQKIQEFAQNYDANMQNEEALTQLFAEFAASQDQFKPSTRQKIKLWLNKTAQTLGIGNLYSDRDIKDAEIKNVLNTLSTKLYQGKKITSKEALSLNTKNLDTFIKGEPLEPGSDLGSVRVSGDTESSGRKVNLQLVNRLGVDIDKIQRGTIKDLDGARAFVFAADQAVVGRIMSPTGVEHDFMGGFLYPYLGQGAWAFTDETNARKVLNKAKETDGVGLVMSQANTGILGSNSFQQYALKEIFNAVNNGADTKYIVDRVNEVLRSNMDSKKKMTFVDYLNKKKLPTSISTVNDLETLFPYTGPNATNYLSRNKFYEKLFNAGMEKQAGIPRFDFGKKVVNRNSLHGITMTEFVNDPALKNVGNGDVVSAIQFDKDSPIIDSRTTTEVKTHPSYPFVLKGKPIMVFNEAYDVRKVAPGFVPKTGNQTPLGKRDKAPAAKAAMGAQPATQLKNVKSEESSVLLQKTTKEGSEAFDKLYNDSDKLAEELSKPKQTRTKKTLNRLSKTFDRQRESAEILTGVEGLGKEEAQRTFTLMKLSQGSNGAGAAQFDEYYVKAFSGLKKKNKEKLNKIVQLRRIIAINESRRKNNKEPYVRVAGKTSIDENLAKQILEYSKEQLGTKEFDDLNNRAEAIFDGYANNLKTSYESGRINEATYLRFKDVEYSPMIVIEEMLQDNEGLYEGEKFDHIMLKYGLSKGDIKTLTNKNSREIVNDQQWLLRMHTAVTSRKAFHNNMLSSLGKAYEKNPEALSEVVKPNPVTRDKNGKPIYKYKSDMDQGRPKNTSVLKYYDNGDPKYLLLDTDFARQLLDVKSKSFTQVSNMVKKSGADVFLGAKPLRYMATIGNPVFSIPAAAMDFSNILLNSNIYSTNLLKAAPELAYNATSTAIRKMYSDSAPIRKQIAKIFGKELSTEDSFKKLYTEWALHGGSMDFLSREGIKDLRTKKQANQLTSAAGKGMLAFGEAMSYFGATSEMTFRLAAYMKQKQNLMNEYKKAEGVLPRGKDLTRILEEAALASRNTINFSDGGSTLKMLDQIIPYLNASFQGFRKVPQAFWENPKETTMKYAQMAMFSASVPMFTYLMLRGLSEDEDEAKKLMRKLREDTGVWERSQYLIVPKKINDDGTIDYFRLRKNPATAPVSALFGEMGRSFMHYSLGIPYKYDHDVVKHALKMSLPLDPTDLQGSLVNRIPTLSAYMTYKTNEDTFFNKKIFYEPYGLDVLPQDEGIYNDRVNNIYKMVGRGLPAFGELIGADIEGFSPIRLQAAVEKILTNPRTNPMMSVAYNSLNAIPTKYGGGYTSYKDYFENISKDISAKLVRTTNPNIKSYDSDNKSKLELIKKESDIYVREEEIKSLIRKHLKGNKDANSLPKEIRDKVIENFPPEVRVTYLNKFNRYMQNRDIDYMYFDIAYAQKPEVQAEVIYSHFGGDLDDNDRQSILIFSKRLGGRVSNKTWAIYNRLYKE